MGCEWVRREPSGSSGEALPPNNYDGAHSGQEAIRRLTRPQMGLLGSRCDWGLTTSPKDFATADPPDSVANVSSATPRDPILELRGPIEKASSGLGFSVSDGFARVRRDRETESEKGDLGVKTALLVASSSDRRRMPKSPERRHVCPEGRRGEPYLRCRVARRDSPRGRAWWRKLTPHRNIHRPGRGCGFDVRTFSSSRRG